MSQEPSNKQVYIFMTTLSIICAVILSVLASALEEPQEIAKEIDRSQQMLIAAGIEAKEDEVLEVYKKRIRPMLVDDKGNLSTFEEKGINYNHYLSEYRKTGFYKQPEKLIYKILPNDGYIIPVNGYGLWDAIYGYIAIENDGETVIGISWYDQKETPGLGAVITEKGWQSLFKGKKIFQQGPDGRSDFRTSPIGINVVKGKVSEVYGNSPKANNAVDGMAGATLTGNGVAAAYKEVLSAYRPFFIKLREKK